MPAGACLVTGVVRGGLVSLNLIEYQSACETRGRTNTGAKACIPGHCANNCPASRADRGTGQRSLLGGVHIRTTG